MKITTNKNQAIAARIAHAEKLEGIAVNVIHNCIGGIRRSAFRHDHREVEHLKRRNGGNHQHEECSRRQHRQRDFPETMPIRWHRQCALPRRAARGCPAGRKENHHVKPDSLPNTDDHQRWQCPLVLVSQLGGLLTPSIHKMLFRGPKSRGRSTATPGQRLPRTTPPA